MAYGNAYGAQPSNNLWVGNNYSAGMPRNNYMSMGQNSMGSPAFGQPQPMNNVLQVMGPESAQAFQIGPNSQVILMDSDKPVFYTKKSDSSGFSKTRAFEFHEIPLMEDTVQIPIQSTQAVSQNNPEYITKSEFEDFKKMIEDLVMKNE